MLPDFRQQALMYETPTLTLNSGDVEGGVEELKQFHAAFAGCFARKESRENAYTYLVGRLSPLERKTIEPIALHVEGSRSVRSMQRSISEGGIDEEAALERYQTMVAAEMGEADGVLMFDEYGVVKKGTDSAGVARQYCGNRGKVENCQVGVFVGYASRQGYALVDKRLYLPAQWFDEAWAEKRRRCQVPAQVSFKTKPELAAEMLLQIYRQGILPFRYIVADTVYGDNLSFIEAADRCIGTTYCVSVPADTLCWLQRPLTTTKTYRYKGKVRTKRILKPPKTAPITVAQVAERLHPQFWYTRTVSEGTKGPITYAFARRRITLAKKGLPWKTVWLIMKRTLGANPTYWFYLSNASTSIRLDVCVWLSGRRWAIEQCFEEGNQEVGMDHYEVRKYQGWHHHMFFCMLAHFFLWHLLLTLKKTRHV